MTLKSFRGSDTDSFMTIENVILHLYYYVMSLVTGSLKKKKLPIGKR